MAERTAGGEGDAGGTAISYNMLKDVLQASNIDDDEEVRSATRSTTRLDQPSLACSRTSITDGLVHDCNADTCRVPRSSAACCCSRVWCEGDPVRRDIAHVIAFVAVIWALQQAVMVTRMTVDPRHVKEFERILRLILKNTHTIGHVSTCVVKPPPGEYTYTSIVKYSSLKTMRQIYPTTVESGVDFYKLFAARDSLLVEPPTYQIEAGFGTWIESDGNTRPMTARDDSDDTNLVYHTIPKPCCFDSCDNPHGLNVRASFVAPTKQFQLFQPRYQRNNKKGGQKNLRCFPCCRNGRHVSSGFCGDSIRVHVAVSRVTETGGIKICPITTTQPAIMAYARFLNLEGAFDPSVSGPEVFPGQTIEKFDLLQWVRDKEHPLNPLFPGILRGAAMESTLQSAIFEFNAECKAWHYGWTAPRGQGLSGSDAQHVLEILFLKPVGAYLFCLERLRSDTFSIYSSRRASHANVKIETAVDEHDDDIESERCFKRKRSHSSTPTSTTSSSSTTTQPSPMRPAPAWSKATPELTASSFVQGLSLPKSDTEVSFKLEQQSTPLPATMQAYNPNDLNLILQANASDQDQQAMFSQTAPFGGLPGDLNLFSNGSSSSDLMNHTLFADAQERRVVSSEELPWSELYNFFDTMPTIVQGDGAADLDEDSPASSPTSSHDSATTSSAGAAAILTYL